MRFPRLLEYLSPGAWVILLGAIASAIAVVAWPIPKRSGRELWLFSPPNLAGYNIAAAEWNSAQANPGNHIRPVLFHYRALERRLMAAFTADAPVADLVETESNIMARAFSGSLRDVGFVDLTDRLHAEGWFEKMNTPSFAVWTSRGRTFGIPHDVHPCLVGYRADLVEAAGIDVSQIETWDDFRRVLGPLVQDLDGDGRPDRYLLNFWENNFDVIQLLTFQAGGGYFDDDGMLQLDTDRNAYVLASLVSWVAGPRRFCVDAQEFTATGDRMRVEGTVIASILADWGAGVWKHYIPALAGKVKLMKMPAWERGGRRTSVTGGTCLAITKVAPDVERAWAMAKYLYLSPMVAEVHFRATCTISPVKAFWDLPFYHEPDPYFSGQKIGALYISEAPHVPKRVSSPFTPMIRDRMMMILGELKAHANERNQFESHALLPEARRLLAAAQHDIGARIARNVLYESAQ